MQRIKRIASTMTVVPLAAMMLACGGSEPANNAAPASNNANKAAAANANTAATNTAAANANTAAPGATAAATVPADLKTLYTAKCAGCHGPDASGGPAGPNLFKEDDKHTSAEWEAYLKNTKIWNKNNKMPVPQLTDDERKKLADWLATAVGSQSGADAKKEGEKKM